MSMTEYRIPQRVAFLFSTLLLTGALSGQTIIDEALMKAACTVIPSDLNENEIHSLSYNRSG